MSGSAVAIDGPRDMNNMRSDAKDRMMYLSVDELQDLALDILSSLF